MNQVSAVFKIGLNKGKRRLWLDGKRLLDAGFVGGSQYRCECVPGAINMALNLGRPGRLRKVTGRPDGKPIIDLLGGDVSAAFPTQSHVLVHFGGGRIQVRPVDEQTDEDSEPGDRPASQVLGGPLPGNDDDANVKLAA